MKGTILILCGDARSSRLCDLLEQDGNAVRRFSALPSDRELQSEIQRSDILVLPTPVTRGESLFGDETNLPWSTLFSFLTPRQHVFGGGFSKQQKQFLQTRGIAYTDFLADSAFVRRNAALTAQGALRLLLAHTERFLPQLRILIAGYGNVGKETAAWLQALGCSCTVAARSEIQRQAAAEIGCNTMPLQQAGNRLFAFDVVINTIPAIWLSEKSLSETKPGDIYLELASAPFGAEKKAPERHGMCCPDGRGLPGRYCPLAAAEAMKDCMDAT